jgi:hypothetical protein
MLTAKLPFEASSPMEMMLAHCNHTVPPLREREPRAEVTDAAEALIVRSLAKHPDDRPADMDEFIAELRTCYGDENFLIVGVDSRIGQNSDMGAGNTDDAAGVRSDTVMLVNIPANRKRVVAVSFPRDLAITPIKCEP